MSYPGGGGERGEGEGNCEALLLRLQFWKVKGVLRLGQDYYEWAKRTESGAIHFVEWVLVQTRTKER